MSRTTIAPDAREWRVGRRWVGRRLRLKKRSWDLGGGDWGFGLDDAGGILLGLLVVVLVVVLFFAVWPIIAIAIELLVLVLALLFGVATRVVFRRPWTIHASAGTEVHEWKVVGWRASRRLIGEVRGALERGLPLPAGAESRGVR